MQKVQTVFLHRILMAAGRQDLTVEIVIYSNIMVI